MQPNMATLQFVRFSSSAVATLMTKQMVLFSNHKRTPPHYAAWIDYSMANYIPLGKGAKIDSKFQ
jgi:hypothetical protein